MLINEIIQPDKIIKINKNFDESKLGPLLGVGLYARVFKGKKPGTVIRVARLESKHDPYIKFLKLALKHQDNPYFPRIYNAKLYYNRSKKGTMGRNYILVIEMEKLVSVESEKIEDAFASFLYSLGYDTKEGSGLDRGIDRFLNDLTIVNGRQEIRQRAVSNGYQNLAEAIDVLGQLFQLFYPDLHEGNIMIRLTGVGPQLVFIDPVA